MKVLLNRKDTIKLLILAELMIRKNCNQREIAEKLRLTPQAISEYFKELVAEGLIRVVQKGYYEATDRGIDWLTKHLFDLHMFSEDLLKKIFSHSLIAIAIGEIKAGDKVYYWFENGLIYCKVNSNANGIALTSANDGEELLIKPIEGFKPPTRGKIIIIKVPDIGEGGSRKIDINWLKDLIKKYHMVVAVGVEALVCCKKAGVEPIFFGGREACIEAAHHGCDVVVVCTESLLDDLLRKIMNENLKFEVIQSRQL